jgi:bacteriocin resistance YdeI/OmpD-like protein/uncharacterized protein DUF1905
MRIKTTLAPRGPAAAVILTDEQVQSLGAATKTPPVQVTVNGHTFAGRVGRMGGENLIGFSKAVREACGVQAGDEVEVEIALDEAPREVELPPALAAVLDAEPELRARYDGLAFTHRKEFARWVSEAKREETRERRVAETVSRLREGRTLS